MTARKDKLFTGMLKDILNKYIEYTKQSAPHRCKIVGMKKDRHTKKNKLLVKINSVKSQIPVSFYPEELVTNDSMLREFSQTDVRSITFYAVNNFKSQNLNAKYQYKIVAQEFIGSKTIFIFKELHTNSEVRMLANELYSDTDLLKKFNFDDLINIIHTAVQEQTIEDVG